MDNASVKDVRKRPFVDGSHTMVSDNSSGGIIALLDLPVGSMVTMNGSAPRVTRRDDFLGVSNVPLEKFHVAVIKSSGSASVKKNTLGAGTGFGPMACGFLVYFSSSAENTCHSVLARRYDPLTEEVSSSKMDELTCRNICLAVAMEGKEALRERVIPYDAFIDYATRGRGCDCGLWENLTRYITPWFLFDVKGLNHGDKLIPSCYNVADDEFEQHGSIRCNKNEITQSEQHRDNDGVEVPYDPIPVFPVARAARRHHAGTANFLRASTTSERTFLCSGDNDGDANIIIEKVIRRHYSGKWFNLVADLQFSFIMFWQLGCYRSLQQWRDLTCLLGGGGGDNSESDRDRDAPTKPLSSASFALAILETVMAQLPMVDPEFIISDESDTFLVDALKRLYRRFTLAQVSTATTISITDTEIQSGFVNRMNIKAKRLREMVLERFNLDLEETQTQEINDAEYIHDNDEITETTTTKFDILHSYEDCDDDITYKADSRNCLDLDTVIDNAMINKNADITLDIENNKESNGVVVHDKRMDKTEVFEAIKFKVDESNDDDDGPVIVSLEEVEVAMARIRRDEEFSSARKYLDHDHDSKSSPSIAHSYPLLYASKTSCEDILMTCARVLDDKVDVSLVREAASYLEQVEAQRISDVSSCF